MVLLHSQQSSLQFHILTTNQRSMTVSITNAHGSGVGRLWSYT